MIYMRRYEEKGRTHRWQRVGVSFEGDVGKRWNFWRMGTSKSADYSLFSCKNNDGLSAQNVDTRLKGEI